MSACAVDKVGTELFLIYTNPGFQASIERDWGNYVQELYVVGYSFGDTHIDLLLGNWLEFSGERSIVIGYQVEETFPCISHILHCRLRSRIRLRVSFLRTVVRSRSRHFRN